GERPRPGRGLPGSRGGPPGGLARARHLQRTGGDKGAPGAGGTPPARQPGRAGFAGGVAGGGTAPPAAGSPRAPRRLVIPGEPPPGRAQSISRTRAQLPEARSRESSKTPPRGVGFGLDQERPNAGEAERGSGSWAVTRKKVRSPSPSHQGPTSFQTASTRRTR